MFTVRRSNEEQPTSLKRVPNGTDDSLTSYELIARAPKQVWTRRAVCGILRRLLMVQTS